MAPAAFSPAMEIRAGHRAPRPTPEDQTSCSKNSIHNTFKSDDKCSPPQKHKHWHEWLSSSLSVIKSVDEISQSKSAEEAWFQRCSGARLFHDAMLLKDICLSWKRWSAGGEQWVQKKEKWNLHSLPPSPPFAAAADDVDQRKVTEGKMHIEKALGNIWCRRQSRLYHSGEKKIRCREIWMAPNMPMHVSQRPGSYQRCIPIWKVHLPPLPSAKWRLDTLIWSARLLLETLNKWHSINSPERHDEQILPLVSRSFFFVLF